MRTVWKKIFSHVDKLIKFTRKYACNGTSIFWKFHSLILAFFDGVLSFSNNKDFNLFIQPCTYDHLKKKKSMLLSIKDASDTWCDKWWPIFITWASYAYLLRDLYSRTEGNPLASSFGHLHVLDLYKRWPITTLYNCTEFKQDLWLI
jgi:hypothetical protein